jgi:carbamoyl-phosphate synthase small subunit
MTLAHWMQQQNVVGLSGVDTRAITEIVREYGTLKGVIVAVDALGREVKAETAEVVWDKPSLGRLVSLAPISKTAEVLVVDCGVKTNQLRCLLKVGLNITIVYHTCGFLDLIQAHQSFKGIFISNGPGDPKDYKHVIDQLREVMQRWPDIAIFGICLGHQLLALASGLDTMKMK